MCCLVGNEFLTVLQTSFMLHVTLYCFASAWRNQQNDRTLPGTCRAIAFSISCETLTSNSSACLICFSSYSLLFLLQLDITRFPFFSFYGETAQFCWATPLLRLLDHTQLDTHIHTFRWTSDQLFADGAVYRHTTKAWEGRHNLKGIRKSNPSKRAAAILRLKDIRVTGNGLPFFLTYPIAADVTWKGYKE